MCTHFIDTAEADANAKVTFMCVKTQSQQSLDAIYGWWAYDERNW